MKLTDAPPSTPPSNSDTTVTLTADDRLDLAFALSGEYEGANGPCGCETCTRLTALLRKLCAAPAAEVAS